MGVHEISRYIYIHILDSHILMILRIDSLIKEGSMILRNSTVQPHYVERKKGRNDKAFRIYSYCTRLSTITIFIVNKSLRGVCRFDTCFTDSKNIDISQPKIILKLGDPKRE